MTGELQQWRLLPLLRHLHRFIYARNKENLATCERWQEKKHAFSEAESQGRCCRGTEHAEILKAKADEKAAKSVTRTEEGKEISHELRKAKEAEAKMKTHEAKAEHAEEKLYGKLHHGVPGHHRPIGAVAPAGTAAPSYPYPTHPHPPGYGAADYK